ncbi:MAG: hypothetical protein GY938_29395, partial [Ketobacter sp.]|nr:hypothetical protein [Ketobacter sp.]
MRYLAEKIEKFEAVQIETNRCLPEHSHALYLKYLSQIEEIGFGLIELYVRYLQKVCYDDTTQMLMSNISDGGVHNAEEYHNSENENELLTDKQPMINASHTMVTPQNRAIFERKRHVWHSQYPVLVRAIPEWLTHLLSQSNEEMSDSQNEQMTIMTRICTLLSCIEFGASIHKREKGAFLRKYRDNKHMNFKRKPQTQTQS